MGDKLKEVERDILTVLETRAEVYVGRLTEFEAEEIAVANGLLFSVRNSEGFHRFFRKEA